MHPVTSESLLSWASRGLTGVLTAGADLLIPPVCLLCRSPLDAHHALCPACWSEMSFIRAPVCDVLGIPLPFDAGEGAVSAAAVATPPDYDKARAVARFSGSMRDLVHQLKYADRHEPRVLLGRWMTDAAADLLPGVDIIVPVPLARWHLLRRQFNQAALLAGEIARRTALPLAPLALARHRATPSQVGKSRAERLHNVAGAFSVPLRHRGRVAGRAVLLVDDVITTGATAGACARALKRAGAKRVDVIALALASDTDAPTV